MQKPSLSTVIVVAVALLLAFGLYRVTTERIVVDQSPTQSLGGSGGTVSVNDFRRKADQTINGLATTTFASLFNGDSTDRIITLVYEFRPQVGRDTTTTVATSTSRGGVLGTSVATFVDPASADPTYQSNSSFSPTSIQVWPANTYLDFQSNVTDTTSTGGIMGVEYVAR